MSIIDKVMAKRGIDKSKLAKERDKNFKWPEMDKVVQIVRDELVLSDEEEHVGIKYDVDTDGLFSGYILEDYLSRKGLKVTRYMNKGKKHGLQESDVEQYVEEGLTWVFIVDAGSGDSKEIRQLTDKGIKVVVLDHHLYTNNNDIDEENSWILNVVDKPELPKLSGCGVVYRFIEMLAEVFEDMVGQYEKFVGITVLSDSCDMSEPENRYYVQRAYEEYRGNYFLQQFPFYGSWKSFYSFGVIPYLNACIRVGEEKQVMETINNMNYRLKMNKIKRDVQRVKTKQGKLVDEIYQVSRKIKRKGITYLLRKEGSELRPVGGLAANQLVNEHGQPALVLQRNGNYWEGSFRSNSYTKDVLEDLGFKAEGHDRACGSKVSHDILKEVVKTFKADVTDTGSKPEFLAELGKVSDKVWLDIARFNEFSGQGMERIVVKLKNKYEDKKYIEEVGKKKRHIVFEQGEIIDFTGSEDSEIIVEPVLKDLEYQLIRV